jgi:hypothetical protein
MSLFLGNLSLADIVTEEYFDIIQKFLDENGYKHTAKCDDIEKEEGNYHIFDMPRQMQVCGVEKVRQFISFLQANDLVEKAFVGRIALAGVDKK